MGDADFAGQSGYCFFTQQPELRPPHVVLPNLSIWQHEGPNGGFRPHSSTYLAASGVLSIVR